MYNKPETNPNGPVKPVPDDPANSMEGIVEEHIASLGRIRAAMTPEKLEAGRLELLRRQDEEHVARMLELLQESKAPKRQLSRKDLDRSGEWGVVEKDMLGRLGTGFMAALIGLRGNGKTQIGVELIRKNAEQYRRSRFCTAMEFFMEIKSGYSNDPTGPTEKRVMEMFEKPKLLVMDEIGQRSENDWANRLLYELLNRRYNSMSDTLLISNQDAGALTLSLGPSLVSRMRETGGIIECNWVSYRK